MKARKTKSSDIQTEGTAKCWEAQKKCSSVLGPLRFFWGKPFSAKFQKSGGLPSRVEKSQSGRFVLE